MTVGLCKLQASSYSAFERVLLAALEGHNFHKAALLVVLLCKNRNRECIASKVKRDRVCKLHIVSSLLISPSRESSLY